MLVRKECNAVGSLLRRGEPNKSAFTIVFISKATKNVFITKLIKLTCAVYYAATKPMSYGTALVPVPAVALYFTFFFFAQSIAQVIDLRRLTQQVKSPAMLKTYSYLFGFIYYSLQ